MDFDIFRYVLISPTYFGHNLGTTRMQVATFISKYEGGVDSVYTGAKLARLKTPRPSQTIPPQFAKQVSRGAPSPECPSMTYQQMSSDRLCQELFPSSDRHTASEAGPQRP